MTLVYADKTASASREFWERAFESGGFSPIGRWSATGDPGEPLPGPHAFGRHQAVVPGALVDAVYRVAARLGAPVTALLVAAHGRVLRDLTGTRQVVTGLRATGHAVLPCRLHVADGTWRQLTTAAQRASAEVLPHQDFPVDELLDELGSTEPLFETVLDLTIDGTGRSGPPSGVLLTSFLLTRRGPGWIRVDYRRDAVDRHYAARIAGYHVRALTLLTDAVDAEHHRQSLLSDTERAYQIDGLAGPERALPDRRLHELFEDQARATPEAVAAVCGPVRWTYDQLNRKANAVAHALLSHGVRAEQPVAVVLDRDLPWLAAVLGVLKAGGAYLPVEPQLPAQRVTAMLDRSGCQLAVTSAAAHTGLDAASPAAPVDVLYLEALAGEGHPDTDPRVAVAADQLAYIYFTSGSTGEPKGAMCEHAGMLNHVLAKVEDLGIGPGQVVAQTAPQCFDISLWQLVSALLVGGQTLVVRQEAILDPDQFVQTIAAAGAEVVQLVPSYLEVVLSRLEPGQGPWGQVRCVSATGEALKPSLVHRWFRRFAQVKLVNAYGLTETSDDTNHELLTGPPEGDLVPLGRAVNNVRVYVVDEHLNLAPLGAPGEIVFSGVCVGRGYVNDEARTRAAFVPDPHRPGSRLYRSGDFGYWMPGGKLAFLGRRDAQVKIRGFRIEIGDVENQLAATPGVREAAVVVAGEPDGDASYLAGFFAADGVDSDGLRRHLAGRLPWYMVPTLLARVERLPLTGNGKIDRARLRALAADHGTAEMAAPRTPTEARLAAAWADVLGVPVDQVSREHHFFERGGTSLLAIRLILKMERSFSLRDLTRSPVLADLAALLDRPPDARPAGSGGP